MWIVVLATGACMVISGVAHFKCVPGARFSGRRICASRAFFPGLGAATLMTMYDYGGYNEFEPKGTAA